MTIQDSLLAQFAADAEKASLPLLDAALEDWASAPDQPLLLVGPAGCGRAQALCRFAAHKAAAGDALVLHHATLATPDAEAPRLLWHLLVQLRRIAAIPEWPPPREVDMREVLPNWLARAAAHGPLWLIIADIDALANHDGHSAWLPDYWPPNLRVAASAELGPCTQHLTKAGWRQYGITRDADTAAAPAYAATPKAEIDPATLAAVGRLLALARGPLHVDTLAALTDHAPTRVNIALTTLQPRVFRVGKDTWALATPLDRQSLLAAHLQDERDRSRLFEALGEHADPVSAAAYFRCAGRRDRALEVLVHKDALLATELPEGRMRWLAQWQALQAGSLLEALFPVLLVAEPRQWLAAAELVDAVGEEVPEVWLERAADGKDADVAARAWLWQAQLATRASDWVAAGQHAQAALNLAQDDEIQANARHELARAAEGAGDLNRATHFYEQALQHQEARRGEESVALLPALGNLIGVLRADRQPSRAESYARRAARIARTGYGPTHPATATACDQLAAVAYAKADYAAAEAAYRETLQIVLAAFGPNHTATAAALHNLGTVLDARRTFVEAEQCYRRALAIREAAYGREHEETASTLHNLAATLETVGRADEAERLYRETTDTWEKLYGAEHPATLSSLTNLAGVLGARGAYADAEVCYRAAAAGWRRLLGDEHPNTLTALAELGRLYANGGKPDLAGPLLEHVVETSHRVLGVTDVLHVNSVCGLAALWREQGRSDDARDLLNRTLLGAERGLGLLAPPVQQLRRQLDTLGEAALNS